MTTRHHSSTMSRFFFSCLFIGAVCGMVGGLMDSADPKLASASIAANSVSLIRILSLSFGHHICPGGLHARPNQYGYTGYDLGTHMKLFLKNLTILSLAAATGSVAIAAKCDRACLDKTVDTYIAAMVAHDPSQVALAADLKFVENTEPKKAGEGLWKTASEGPTTFKIYVPDPVAQQVGFLGMIKEDGKPIQLGLRLKLKDGKIVEAEHLIARNLRENMLKNL